MTTSAVILKILYLNFKFELALPNMANYAVHLNLL